MDTVQTLLSRLAASYFLIDVIERAMKNKSFLQFAYPELYGGVWSHNITIEVGSSNMTTVPIVDRLAL